MCNPLLLRKKSEVRNLKLETGFWVPVTMWSLYLPVENLPGKKSSKGFPGGWDDKESACNAGDLGSIPGWGRSPGEGNGNPLHYSCLGNPLDRGAWWATVHGVTRAGHDLVTKPPTPNWIVMICWLEEKRIIFKSYFTEYKIMMLVQDIEEIVPPSCVFLSPSCLRRGRRIPYSPLVS